MSIIHTYTCMLNKYIGIARHLCLFRGPHSMFMPHSSAIKFAETPTVPFNVLGQLTTKLCCGFVDGGGV